MIVTQTPDNISQKDKLIDAYVTRVIDSMDLDDCLAILHDYMTKSYEDYSLKEMKEEVEEYYPDMLEWPLNYQYKYPVLCYFSLKKGLINVYKCFV